MSLLTSSELNELRSFLTPQERDELDRLLTTARQEAAPSTEPVISFREYVSKVKPRYLWYPHCIRLAEVLQRVADGELSRVMVFMPPRHGKSELVSRLFSAYYLYRHPERWVGINSYAADLAYTLSRASRDNFRAADGELRGDAEAVKHWETTGGGGLWAAGVGGPITGKGFHLGIIDDPLKNAEEANSLLIRAKHKEWYQSTFYTREEPGGAVVVIQTRWHEDDLSGWLLTQETEEDQPERWHIVSFPAIAAEQADEYPATCTTEPDYREPGEALCAERYPLEKLKKIAARVGAFVWEALFQGRPTAKEGALFKVGKLEYCNADELPKDLEEVRAWDQAATEGGGDWSAGVRMGKSKSTGRYYVVGVRRGQWGSDKRDAEIRQTAAADGRPIRILGNQDPGSAGKDMALAFSRMLAGYTVKTERVSGPKETRADPFSSQVNAGNVTLVRGTWNTAYVEELRVFPVGLHDDQVDASSDAFNDLAGKKVIDRWF